ncbi:MAG: nucleotidyltransferase domain-containing protein, partial [Spirochaetaceae bacterium]
AKPIGKDCIERARKLIATAKQHYADSVLSDDLNTVRFAAAQVLCNLTNALVHLNNTYFTRGVKRYLEEIATFAHKPEDFEQKYMAVAHATTIADARAAAFEMLAMMTKFCDHLSEQFVEKPVPTFENLRGTYEELWCNYRNKVVTATQNNDVSYAFHAAMDAQDYLDLMADLNGTPKIELMSHFNPDDLAAFREVFLSAMDEYLNEYSRVGREVERFESFEQLYDWYMTTS